MGTNIYKLGDRFINHSRETTGEYILIDDIVFERGDAVLVVESPHTEELKAKHLLAGASGMGVSKVLFGLDHPIGEIIKTLPFKLSLLNTFQYAEK